MTPETRTRLDVIGQAARSTLPTLYFSYEAAETVILEGHKGDFVECGVFAGAQCAAMALACQAYGDNRKIHLFDSFEGIPDAGPQDDARLSGQSVSSLENTQKFMALWGIENKRLVYHKGWFKDTLPKTSIPRIAILRLDADLYASTKICLDCLYPSLVEGGYLIIDDYALDGCRMAVHEYFVAHRIDIKFSYIEKSNGPAYCRKHS